jgi:hypothetical protein
MCLYPHPHVFYTCSGLLINRDCILTIFQLFVHLQVPLHENQLALAMCTRASADAEELYTCT